MHFPFSILTNLLFRQNSTWSLNWSIASNSREIDPWPVAIARTSMKIMNLFTIPHRMKYKKDGEKEEDGKRAVTVQHNQCEMKNGKVDDSKFSTTTI